MRTLLCTALVLLASARLPAALGQAHAPFASGAGLERSAGTEEKSQIQYVQIVLAGTLISSPVAPAKPPTLIGQCTLRPNGKYVFEMFTNFGDATPLEFYAPWAPLSRQDHFPPRTEKVTITMDFLGYTKVKPAHRQWEMPVENPTQYRYNPPGGGSSNLEEIAYDLRYLLALPTLRLTLEDKTAKGGKAAEFMTAPWLNALRAEPLCRAAAL